MLSLMLKPITPNQDSIPGLIAVSIFTRNVILKSLEFTGQAPVRSEVTWVLSLSLSLKENAISMIKPFGVTPSP